MRKYEYDQPTFAEEVIQSADKLISLAKLRIELAAARQRLDRALLALGEETYRQASSPERTALDINQLQETLTRVRNAMRDRDRIQERMEQARTAGR